MDLPLYCLLLSSSLENSISLKLLSDFKLKRINIENSKSKIFNKNEIYDISTIFDKLENDPEIVLKNIENIEEKVKIKRKLFFIILCFRFFYERYKFENSLKNILSNEDTKNQIYKDISKYHDIFEGINYEKEQISEMVKVLEKFRRIKRALSNLDNISDYIEIILAHLEHISSIRIKDLKDKDNKPENLVLKFDENKIRKSDDIKNIYENYIKILDKLKDKEIENFVILSPELIEKYIKKFNNNNLENLIILKNLVIKITKNIKIQNKTIKTKKEKGINEEILKKYETINTKLKEIIHNTGLNLAINKKLNNIQILDFLNEDKDYLKNNNDDIEKKLEIFQGLNVSEIDDIFLEKWKNMDLTEIFGDNQKKIDEYIIDLIDDFKNFKILIKMLNISKNDDKEELSREKIKIMQYKFIRLLIEQEKIENQNYQDDFAELI